MNVEALRLAFICAVLATGLWWLAVTLAPVSRPTAFALLLAFDAIAVFTALAVKS